MAAPCCRSSSDSSSWTRAASSPTGRATGSSPSSRPARSAAPGRECHEGAAQVRGGGFRARGRACRAVGDPPPRLDRVPARRDLPRRVRLLGLGGCARRGDARRRPRNSLAARPGHPEPRGWHRVRDPRARRPGRRARQRARAHREHRRGGRPAGQPRPVARAARDHRAPRGGAAGRRRGGFPTLPRREAPEIVAAERRLLEARRDQLEAQVAVMREQGDQRRSEIGELEARIVALERSRALAQQELAIVEPLIRSGSGSRIELVRIQQRVNDIQTQLTAAELALPRARNAHAEVLRRIDERRATFRSEASTDLNQRRAQLAALTEKLQADRDRVTRTEVRSPVRGTIKDMKVSTVGGVIRPGQDILEIVPLEDTLLVEAQLRPADIAFVRPGQPATVKVTAYDFSIFGGLEAELEQISADTIQDERGERWFRVRLRTQKAHLGTEEKPLPIIPGMTAGVEILTGRKTVLDYLMKPILKARDRALRER
ncbi:MAG: HlyD family type I secretion periplasmic adaptor subunit [Alphaproteobacteria bacterium]|nr:HlyD family type I secretion periplasmic adaptor subunit [Alphaproteobacteria bacterium]